MITGGGYFHNPLTTSHVTVAFIQEDVPLLIIALLLSTENQELSENISHGLTGIPSEYAFLYDKILSPS